MTMWAVPADADPTPRVSPPVYRRGIDQHGRPTLEDPREDIPADMLFAMLAMLNEKDGLP